MNLQLQLLAQDSTLSHYQESQALRLFPLLLHSLISAVVAEVALGIQMFDCHLVPVWVLVGVQELCLKMMVQVVMIHGMRG